MRISDKTTLSHRRTDTHAHTACIPERAAGQAAVANQPTASSYHLVSWLPGEEEYKTTTNVVEAEPNESANQPPSINQTLPPTKLSCLVCPTTTSGEKVSLLSSFLLFISPRY